MKVGLTRPLVCQSVNEEGVRVEVEYDRAVSGEDRGILAVRETVWVVDFGDEFEEVDNVDEADLKVRDVFTEKGGGS